MIKSLSIIFPLYNENKRLKYCFQNIDIFNSNSSIKKLEYIFVDDGSVDNSYQLILDFIKKRRRRKEIKYKIIKFNKNKGKGAALISGIKNASKDWMLTIDVDISVSLLEINNWIKYNYFEINKEIYFGSRNLKKSIIKFEYHRKLIGLFFILICKLFLNIKLYDTQCGFKLYKKKTGKMIFNKLTEKKFAHDIEIVLLATKKKIEIIELPVKWVHKNDSKINLIRDSFSIFWSIYKMKKKFNQ
jgi:glycosyltransferase involved in cell wall biosynthesis